MRYINQGKELHEKYISGRPFPNIVLDNFFDDEEISGVLDEIAVIPEKTWRHDDHDHQVHKSWIPDPYIMPLKTRQAFEQLNSQEMLNFLSDLTGIPDLLIDPSLLGGGIHRTTTGGHLEIHADFNIHPEYNLHRRLNVLVYLNPEWKDEWNGALELWERDMSQCSQVIYPVFNRAVIFTITDNAFHGHPKPLLGPQRLSFATYYYTKDRPPAEISPFHWASWQRRR